MRTLLVASVIAVLLISSGCTYFKTATRPAEEPEEMPAVTYYEVQKGDSLWKIAGYDFIYGDSNKWRRIYEANQDKLSSPDALLKPKMVLVIPLD